MIDISGSLEGVGTGLCDSVDTTTDEVGLAHVVRGNHDLKFLNGVNRDRIATTGKSGAKAEVVIEVRSVNSEVGGTSVHTGEGSTITTVRRKPGDIGNAS